MADSRSPRDGRFIEILGHYDPRKHGTDKVVVNAERTAYWLGVGAEVSDTVASLLKAQGIELPERKKRKQRRRRTGPAAGASSTLARPAEAVEQPTAEEAPVGEDATAEQVAEPVANENEN